jgi:hypothetical protein
MVEYVKGAQLIVPTGTGQDFYSAHAVGGDP